MAVLKARHITIQDNNEKKKNPIMLPAATCKVFSETNEKREEKERNRTP